MSICLMGSEGKMNLPRTQDTAWHPENTQHNFLFFKKMVLALLDLKKNEECLLG